MKKSIKTIAVTEDIHAKLWEVVNARKDKNPHQSHTCQSVIADMVLKARKREVES